MSVKINVVMKNNSATTDLRMKEREIKGRDRTEESDDQMFLKILVTLCVCVFSFIPPSLNLTHSVLSLQPLLLK